MADSHAMGLRATRHPTARGLAAALILASVIAVSGQAYAGSAPPSSGAGTSTTTSTTTLPAIPKVPLSDTDGQSAQTLLTTAIELSSVGIDTSALQTAIAATQAKLDEEAATANKATQAAAAANATAQKAHRQADTAGAAYTSMASAVQTAVLYLYTNGSQPLQVSPQAGQAAVFAQDYADSTLSPYGILATRQEDATLERGALAQAKKLQHQADRDAAKASKALAAEQGEANRLETELASISRASATQVTADHLALATQAGAELLSASALQFDPKTPLSAPVSTTPVALTWAFSELGKRYVWGATGPNTFDCSGLTQFVWKAAGVSIPRVAAAQDAWAIPVPLSQLLPGDLVFYGRTDIHHVGIYIGDGLMINAPHTGTVVQVSSIWWSDLAGFGRVHAPGTPVPPHQTPSATKPAAPVVVAAAGPVPSQTKPPPGWKPKPGGTTPIVVNGGVSGSRPIPTTTTTTVAPTTTTTTTLLPPVTLPDETTTTVSSGSPPTSASGT